MTTTTTVFTVHSEPADNLVVKAHSGDSCSWLKIAWEGPGQVYDARAEITIFFRGPEDRAKFVEAIVAAQAQAQVPPIPEGIIALDLEDPGTVHSTLKSILGE